MDPYGQYDSPYMAMGNSPIMLFDMDGGWSGGGDGKPGFFGRIWGGITSALGFSKKDIAWENQLDEVVITSKASLTGKFSESNHLFDKLWNSPTARMMVPDLVNINLNFSTVVFAGQGENIGLNMITRCPDAGVYLTATAPSIRVGFHGDLSINGSQGYFVGDSRKATIESLLGKTVDVSVDISGIGVGGWAGLNENNRPTWVGSTFGVGLGHGASAGFGYTMLIGGFRF